MNLNDFAGDFGRKLRTLEAVKSITGSCDITQLYYDAKYILQNDIFPKQSKEIKLYVCSPGIGITEVRYNTIQSNFDANLKDNTHNIILAPRQSGKSTFIIFDAIKKATTASNKKIMILVGRNIYKDDMSLKRDFILNEPSNQDNLPGLIEYNKYSVKFDNGSSIYIRTMDEDCMRDLSVDETYIDEFDYISNSVLLKSMPAILPRSLKINMFSTKNENNDSGYVEDQINKNIFNISTYRKV